MFSSRILSFSAIAQMMKHSQAQFRALGNMGDVLLKTEDGTTEAVAVYGRQLALAKQLRDRGFEAAAFGSLGVCHRRAGQFDKALGCHTQVRFMVRGDPFITFAERGRGGRKI